MKFIKVQCTRYVKPVNHREPRQEDQVQILINPNFVKMIVNESEIHLTEDLNFNRTTFDNFKFIEFI